MLTDEEINRRIVAIQAAVAKANQNLIELLNDIGKDKEDGQETLVSKSDD